MDLQWELEEAIAGGNVEEVRNLVIQSSRSTDGNRYIGYRREIPNINVDSVFLASIRSKNVDIIDLILQIRPSPSVRFTDDRGRRVLHFATETGSLEVVKKIITLGSIVNVIDNEGSTPLMIAASKGYADIVEFLLQKGGRANRAHLKRTGESVLHLAALGGHYDVVEVLLRHQADVNYQVPPEKGGMTPLHKAVISGNTDVVRLLHQRGADTALVDGFGRCPFHMAAFKGLTEMVKVFIELGIDLEMTDEKKRTALHQAVVGKCVEVVKLLLESGADVRAADLDGYQALHKAAAAAQVEIVKVLLGANADVNVETGTRHTPIMDACLAGSPEIVDLLILHGADVDRADINGRTSLHKAQICAKDMKVKEELSLQLIKGGARLSPLDADRFTPLHNLIFQCVVNSQQNFDAIKMFVRYGANLVPEVSEPRGQVDIFAADFTLLSLSKFRNSPLCSLTWNGFYAAARFLVLAGWDLSRENWLDLPGKSPEHNTFLAWLRDMASQPPALSLLCRNAVRRHLSGLTEGREIMTAVSSLPVPTQIRTFLSLEDI